MILQPGSKLVMTGDSVTDCGRARPVGEARHSNIGNGYVAHVSSLLRAVYPARRIRVVNTGCSGNTAADLEKRWDTDVLALKPDWVSVMIGINDVWRQFDAPEFPEGHVMLADYERILDGLVGRTLPRVRGMVLMTPYYVEPLAADPMRAKMDEYGAAVKAVAARHQVRCVDTQAVFNRALRHQHSSWLSWDRVHPEPVGHMLLAKAFLDAVGFDWNAAE